MLYSLRLFRVLCSSVIFTTTTLAQMDCVIGEVQSQLDIIGNSMYQTYHTDTAIQFHNGEHTYYALVLSEFRRDTVIDIYGKEFSIHADSLKSFESPHFSQLTIAISPPQIDTLFDPFEPNYILYIDSISFQNVEFAERYPFSLTTVLNVRERISEQAQSQGLTVKETYIRKTRYWYDYISIDKCSLEDETEDFVLYFLLVNEAYEIRYPVLIEF